MITPRGLPELQFGIFTQKTAQIKKCHLDNESVDMPRDQNDQSTPQEHPLFQSESEESLQSLSSNNTQTSNKPEKVDYSRFSSLFEPSQTVENKPEINLEVAMANDYAKFVRAKNNKRKLHSL